MAGILSNFTAVLAVIVTTIALVASADGGNTVADVKMGLIAQMKADGYLTETTATEVAEKYVTEDDSKMEISQGNNNAGFSISRIPWRDYLSFVNFIKVASVILFLIAFGSFIAKIGSGILYIINKVPIIYYQLSFLSFTLFGTVCPTKISQSQYFYVALFCSFANLILIGWFVSTHRNILEIIAKIFGNRIPQEIKVNLILLIYFVALTLTYRSSVFGFFSAVCLSGVFSFGLLYTPGTLYLYFNRNMLAPLILGHLFVLIGYTYIHANHVYTDYMQYFDAGIQYYCTVALCVGLLVGSSPFAYSGRYKEKWMCAFLFVIVFVLATVGYFFLEMKVAASFIFCFFVLFVIEWVGYLGFQNGLLTGSFLLGLTLYGCSFLLEKYSSMIVFTNTEQ